LCVCVCVCVGVCVCKRLGKKKREGERGKERRIQMGKATRR